MPIILWYALYAVLFLAFGMVWLWPIAKLKNNPKNMFTLLVSVPFALVGALMLYVTLKIQPPIQTAYIEWAKPMTYEGSWMKALMFSPAILVTGFVQELLKMLPLIVVALFGFKDKRLRIWALAAGFGFGVWEALYLAGFPLAKYGGWMTIPVIERFSAIGFHIGATALAGYGVFTRKGVKYYLIATVLHGLLNMSAILIQLGLLSIWQTEIWVFAGAAITWYWAYQKWNLTETHGTQEY